MSPIEEVIFKPFLVEHRWTNRIYDFNYGNKCHLWFQLW